MNHLSLCGSQTFPVATLSRFGRRVGLSEYCSYGKKIQLRISFCTLQPLPELPIFYHAKLWLVLFSIMRIDVSLLLHNDPLHVKCTRKHSEIPQDEIPQII